MAEAGMILGLVTVLGGLTPHGMDLAGALVGADFTPVGQARGMVVGMIHGMVHHGDGAATGVAIGDTIIIIRIMQLHIRNIITDVLLAAEAMPVQAHITDVLPMEEVMQATVLLLLH